MEIVDTSMKKYKNLFAKRGSNTAAIHVKAYAC